jgi:hypothetical protein
MGIADLETLSAWHNARPIQQVLLDRKGQSGLGAEQEDFSAFLWRYAREHGLAPAHPLLEDVAEDFFKRHFDFDPNVSEPPLDDEALLSS